MIHGHGHQPDSEHRSDPAKATSGPAASATGSAPPAPAPADLQVVPALIPYPAARLAEMAAYSLRHSGSTTWGLHPSVIVLHYTAGGTWSSTRDSFATDVANLGELPNVCAHYIVDQDGTVSRTGPSPGRDRLPVRADDDPVPSHDRAQRRGDRHRNDVAIGIEMVQAAGSGPAWADQQILGRPAQVGAALALVRSLQAQFGIVTENVIGHAMGNGAPQFHDILGWRNDHVDWPAADVAVFRSRP